LRRALRRSKILSATSFAQEQNPFCDELCAGAKSFLRRALRRSKGSGLMLAPWYAGIDIQLHQSGKLQYQDRINKLGNRRLR
ncbi:hypothetical protein ACFVR1_01215, partial [Psychrobacillus sp. NPDC058041]